MGLCTHGYSVSPSYSPTRGRRPLNAHVLRKTQNPHTHLLSVPARFASSLPTPFPPPGPSSLLYVPHLLITHCPLGGPPSSPGLCCLGENALGCLLDRAGRGVSNLLALLTLLVPFPPLTSASRSKKPRRDTSRRYCMGHVPTYPAIQIPSSCVTIPQQVPGSHPGTISAPWPSSRCHPTPFALPPCPPC